MVYVGGWKVVLNCDRLIAPVDSFQNLWPSQEVLHDKIIQARNKKRKDRQIGKFK